MAVYSVVFKQSPKCDSWIKSSQGLPMVQIWWAMPVSTWNCTISEKRGSYNQYMIGDSKISFKCHFFARATYCQNSVFVDQSVAGYGYMNSRSCTRHLNQPYWQLCDTNTNLADLETLEEQCGKKKEKISD